MNAIKLIKEYLPLLIVIPTFLGGIWQVLELSFMSISFVRFFSITQLVADGILIIIVILPWIINSLIFIEIYNSIKKDTKFVEINVLKNVLGFFFLFILYCAMVYIIYNNTIKEFGLNNYYSYLLIVTLIYILFFIILVFFTKFFIKFLEFILNKYKTKKTFYIFMILTFLFMLFHNLFFIPNNLENISNLSQGKIIYFNDKYIFIENEENKKIKVIKFDKLFKE